jgi:hypothetical protein
MCGVMRLQNNIQSGVSGWQVVGSFRAGDALVPQGAVGAQLVGGSSGISRQPFRLVAADGSPQLGPKGGVTHLLLQAAAAPPKATPAAADQQQVAALDKEAGGEEGEGGQQEEAGELQGNDAGSTQQQPQYMVIEVSPALTSVYVNGLECTRLPWDILGGEEGAPPAAAAAATRGPPECQASDWGLGPNGWLGDPTSDALGDAGDMGGDLVEGSDDGDGSMAGSWSSRAAGLRGGSSRQRASSRGWGTSWGSSSSAGSSAGAHGSGAGSFSTPNSSSDLLGWLRGTSAPAPNTTNTTDTSSSSGGSRRGPGSFTPSAAAARVEAWAGLLRASPWAQLGPWHGGDPAAAASRLLSCLSHYCCGLQVVEPPPGGAPGGTSSGSGNSSNASSNGEEAPVRAASGQREVSQNTGWCDRGQQLLSDMLLHLCSPYTCAGLFHLHQQLPTPLLSRFAQRCPHLVHNPLPLPTLFPGAPRPRPGGEPCRVLCRPPDTTVGHIGTGHQPRWRGSRRRGW